MRASGLDRELWRQFLFACEVWLKAESSCILQLERKKLSWCQRVRDFFQNARTVWPEQHFPRTLWLEIGKRPL